MDFIKEFWENQGKSHKSSHEASWGDIYMLQLEIDTIGRHLMPGMAVLDVGCANGYSTFQQWESKSLASMVGIDFAENMVREARATKAEKRLGDEVRFEVGDVRKIDLPDAAFDVVYTTRVLINLPNWQEQQQGIRECLRVTRPGGKAIFSEAFWEPLMLLNAMRSLKQLEPLVEHDFNRYLKMQRLQEFLSSLGLRYEVVDFSSIYYLGSRFLRELVTDPAAYPGYSNPINGIFYNIEKEYSGGGFGIQQAVVVYK